MKKEFKSCVDRIINAFNKFHVEYKLVGGTVIALVNPERYTEDMDFEIKSNIENVKKIINALVDCGFSTHEELQGLLEDRFSEEDGIPNNMQIFPTLSGWEVKNFHLDICESIRGISYDDLGTEIYDYDGLKIIIAPFKDILRMKENVGNLWDERNNPREKDLNDIAFICDTLGLTSKYYKKIEKDDRMRLMDAFTKKRK